MSMNIYTLLTKLRNDKVFTIKQLAYIENIYIYISNLKVYKLVLSIYPKEIKKAKKLGLNSQYIIINKSFGKINEPLKNTSKGNYILIYSPNSQDITVWNGEEFI